jgi:N-methylhydantoinase A/oxoprolinase/acetone carboxylase beta subunit/N-methylhydantoinase B/oxoprolinase/acetone carboxylase alpha subunit
MKQNRIAVDIGGTFTDIVVELKDGSCASVKTPTTPEDPVIGAMSGIQAVLREAGISLDQVGMIVHGTTLATNTLIEKKGACVGLILSSGFRDVLEIGYERRYDQEDLFIDKPDLLVPRERCLTVDERLLADGSVLTALDESGLQGVLDRFGEYGVESVAVCLLHSYVNPVHEHRIAELLKQMRPHLPVSLSSGVCPEIREFDRTCTTVANAYVKPLIASYLDRFEIALGQEGFIGRFFMMTSAGGMTTLDTARQYPVRLVESGPAGGAVLACRVAHQCGLERAVSFDMGGTTAKFCIIDDAQPLTSRSFEVARAHRFTRGSGMPLRIPAIEMIEIGAGGGSIAAVDPLERITIGPESMGARPGPASFGRGGDRATVTDADVVLGHVDESSFSGGQLAIDGALAESAVTRDVGDRLGMDPVASAHGILRVVGENMANAGRVHAAERGAALAGRTMIAFGGNGPLHATRVARKMGVDRIIVPGDPGVGSAVGFLIAPVSFEIVSSLYTTLHEFDFAAVNRLLEKMTGEAMSVVNSGGEALKVTRAAFMRYAGQGHEIEVRLPDHVLSAADMVELVDAYDTAYRRQFKRTVPGMRIEIMNWTVKVESEAGPLPPSSAAGARGRPVAAFQRPISFDTALSAFDTAVYYRDSLAPGDEIRGPALILEQQTSTLVEPEFDVVVDGLRNLVVTLRDGLSTGVAGKVAANNIDLQLMWNRLLAVVEEQAQALIRSAFSPIVRECGDISAGIFDRSGRMLAQAVTGTPGHINTMAASVANFLDIFRYEEMNPGDVYVTNDPWLAAGHLNDFMLVQPVFQGAEVVGFTSCTSHLVDVGGLCMGPEGSDVYDEGLLVPPSRLVTGGEVNSLLLDIIKANSRRPIENEGDLYALIACCEVGADRLQAMMDEYGLDSLQPLADHIIDSSYGATVASISRLPKGVYKHAITLDGYDFEIELRASLSIAEDDIVVDFSGSSACSKCGINVPLNYAAAYSVFAIRCAVASGIPNNAGSLFPFRIDAPEGCIVNAVHPAPVAMRHTIGQLLPDLIFGCLHQALPDAVPAEGASCMYDIPMRNLPVSDKTSFAIELVHNGGTGARPGKDGLSATAYPSGVWGSQVEITECTAPLRVVRRELRPDSGGMGKHRGGLGQIIEIESSEGADFLLFLSLDRVNNPARGRAGGAPGAPGRVRLSSGRVLPGRGEEVISAGETLIFQTPGGGGYGDPRLRDQALVKHDVDRGLVSVEAAREQYGFDTDDPVDSCCRENPITRSKRIC